MMRHAFEAGTDTQQMWRSLQENCLLIPKQRQAVSPPSRQKSEPGPLEAADRIGDVAPYPPLPKPVAVREPTRLPASTRRRTFEDRIKRTPRSRYRLVLQNSQHRIALPADGEVVLGRFDPTANIAPDVDLSYDDRESRVISRRHACIVGHNGQIEIEDLGSTNGTRVNGMKLGVGQKVQLRPGDRVILGYHTFIYGLFPKVAWSPHDPPLACLRATFTGHRFPLPSWGEVVIGRSDPVVGLIPDIDLSREENAAHVVARRHVKIVARGGRHYAEDLGSANGTKLNGARIRIGELGLLEPGDHLWLGGYVLAYDVELRPGRAGPG